MAHGLSGFAGGAVAAAELWCEYAVDPLGIDVAEPRFSWILVSERRGQVQSAYRILVASSADLLRGGVGDKWDSGVVASEASVNVPYAGAALASGERCFWQVRVWDGDGAGSGWSDPARFEMGLLDRGDWGGSWIGAEGDLADRAAPLLRKEFTIEEPVGEARLYLCGLGLYELSINGARVGDQVLDPALTDYRERAPYVTHDVTRCLRRGRNVIGVMLGAGWYRGLTRQHFRFSGPQRRTDRHHRRATWRKREQRAGRTARRLRLLLLPPHRLLNKIGTVRRRPAANRHPASAQNLRDQSAGQRSTTTLVWVKNSTACLPWPCRTPKKLLRQPENGK